MSTRRQALKRAAAQKRARKARCQHKKDEALAQRVMGIIREKELETPGNLARRIIERLRREKERPGLGDWA